MKRQAVALTCLLFLLVFAPSMPSGAAVTTVEVSIPGEPARTADGSPLMITGLWHYVNVTLDVQTATVDLTLYEGAVEPAEKNASNYYHWAKDAQGWKALHVEELGYPDSVVVTENPDGSTSTHNFTYKQSISPSKCSVSGAHLAFYVGVHEMALKGDWTMDINGFQTVLELEGPDMGFGLSRPDYAFDATVGSDDKLGSDLSMTSRNLGNVPIKLSFSASHLEDAFRLTNGTKTLKVGEEGLHYLSFQPNGSWASLYLDVTVKVWGSMLYTIPGQFSYAHHIEHPVKVKVVLAREGLETAIVGGVMFQYEKTLRIPAGKPHDVKVYATGSGDAGVTAVTDKLDIESVSVDGTVTSQPAAIPLNGTEKVLALKVMPRTENIQGSIVYEASAGGETSFFTTAVEVGETEGGGTNWLLAGGLIAAIAAAVIVLFWYFNYGPGVWPW